MTRERLTENDKKNLRFAQFEPLYQMWLTYYKELIGLEKGRQPDERLLKADYHGAMLMVTEADNESMVGICGIVALETRHTFQLITRKDKYVVIPKKGSTFQFAIDGKVVSLFGDAMRFKPCLRGKKQRLRTSVPFFLK